MGRRPIARIPGPWWYYFPQLAYYETATLVAALFAFRWRDWRSDPLLRTMLVASPPLAVYVAIRAKFPAFGGPAALVALVLFVAGWVVATFLLKPPPESTLSPFVQFLAFWAVGSLAIYAWAREKVPWLTVHPLLPLTILGAMGVTRLWDDRGRTSRRVALAVVAALFAVNVRERGSPSSGTARTTSRRSRATPRCSPTFRRRGTSCARSRSSNGRRRASRPART